MATRDVPPSDARLSARLWHLSHEQLTALVARTSHARLAEIVANLVVDEPEVQAAAAEALRQDAPVQAYTQVFESPELVTTIMSEVTLEDYPVRAVCSTWLRSWLATRHMHGLHESAVYECGAFGLRNIYAISSCGDFCYISGEMVQSDTASSPLEGIAVVDRRMQLVRTIRVSERAPYYGDMPIAASEVGLFVAAHDESMQVIRLPLLAQTGERVLASSRGSLDSPHLFTLVPSRKSGLLYATLRRGRRDDSTIIDRLDNIVALDLRTLDVRFYFGAGVVRKPGALAIVDNELYVGGSTPGVIHVFSLFGKPLRNVHGAWRIPWALAYTKGRLYMIEDAFEAPDAEDDETLVNAKRHAGRSLLVISPESGHVLQVYEPRASHQQSSAAAGGGSSSSEQAGVFVSISVFGDRLICAMASETSGPCVGSEEESDRSAVITVLEGLGSGRTLKVGPSSSTSDTRPRLS